MSETRFKAAYVTEVTDVAEELTEKFAEWNIEVLESDPDAYHYVLEEPFQLLHNGDDCAVLQYVIEDTDEVEGVSISFNHEKAQKLIRDIKTDHEELFKFIFRNENFAMYPVAYTYHTSCDEPVIL